MLSIGNWMKLYRLERFPRHLVISFQFLRSPALWQLLLLVVKGEQEWEKCNSEKLDLCVHKLSVGYWKFYEYPFGKLTPTKKNVQYFCHCRIVFCCGICLAWWGERTSNQELFMAFPAQAVYQSAPHQLAVLPRGCTTAGSCWSMTGWLPPLPSPKCQRGWALMSELAPGNLPRGSKGACSGARDSEPGQSLILLLLLYLLLLLLLLLLFSSTVFLVSLRKIYTRKKTCHLS